MVGMKKRKYYKNIWADFNKEKEMIFISGARQTGKTTMAKDIASEEPVSQQWLPHRACGVQAGERFGDELKRWCRIVGHEALTAAGY